MTRTRPPCPCGGCRPANPSAGWGKHGPHELLGRVLGGWVDHPYRLRGGGHTTWVAEPYSLNVGAFAEFEVLRQASYQVSVYASQARHLPGSSIAVHITKARTTA